MFSNTILAILFSASFTVVLSAAVHTAQVPSGADKTIANMQETKWKYRPHHPNFGFLITGTWFIFHILPLVRFQEIGFKKTKIFPPGRILELLLGEPTWCFMGTVHIFILKGTRLRSQGYLSGVFWGLLCFLRCSGDSIIKLLLSWINYQRLMFWGKMSVFQDL